MLHRETLSLRNTKQNEQNINNNRKEKEKKTKELRHTLSGVIFNRHLNCSGLETACLGLNITTASYNSWHHIRTLGLGFLIFKRKGVCWLLSLSLWGKKKLNRTIEGGRAYSLLFLILTHSLRAHSPSWRERLSAGWVLQIVLLTRE